MSPITTDGPGVLVGIGTAVGIEVAVGAAGRGIAVGARVGTTAALAVGTATGDVAGAGVLVALDATCPPLHATAATPISTT
ncbi:MAG: hypothetical protein QGI49_11310, partial [SAR202 cluster bacterium]|nr:hypothetical protein [SAR202 cluster bacterium]